MRLFVGIPLKDELRNEIADRIDAVRADLPPARWVPERHLHVTLVFLGEVGEKSLGALGTALDQAVADRDRFELELEGGGTFPAHGRARVAWIGAEGEDLVALERLRDAVEEGTAAALERPRDLGQRFHAHVTVARPRLPWREAAKIRFASAFAARLGRLAVDEIVLFSSELEPSGAHYEALGRYALG